MSDKRTKKHFRSDGSSVWSRRNIDGPGVWVACVKGKERQTVGEICDLFDSLAEELWPLEEEKSKDENEEDNTHEDEDEDPEKAIAKELQKLKRPRRERRFASCKIDSPCLVFISCKPPVDPVVLLEKHVNNVAQTGVTRTRSTLRLTPVSNSCDANIPEIISLCKRIAVPAFQSDAEGEPKSYRYKIEIRIRNHSTVTRDEVIKAIAECIPPPHTVNLDNPDLFILVEIFKATCGISVVRDYYRLKKFNVIELSQAVHAKQD
ncbi:hypothetical protein PNOK_0781500 [Pyrrhoderma noxium]|uniref:THUMP domain-containing protein n=1 Tax=Pyrrhoderma noxium TaxID=2282107 RepID=A0A286U9G2_9AGAM|nr:hypothetical protein PNOK_0781500 [Pyrrhoderma noxium]